MASTRGVFENPKTSGIWWVHWYDGEGKRHREKAGTKAAAIKLKAKRTTDKLESRKLPELGQQQRSKPVTLSELMADALENSIHENSDSATSNLRGVINALAPKFGERPAASIKTLELLTWLRRRAKTKEWADGTYNHYVIQLKVTYKLGMQHGKVAVNPADDLKRKPQSNDRPRYLTEDEASRLDAAFSAFPYYYPAYLFAKNTGLRAGAQFRLTWLKPGSAPSGKEPQVDMERRKIILPTRKNSKYRKHREMPINSVALEVLLLQAKAHGTKGPVFPPIRDKDYLTKPAHWFPRIVRAAGVENFTWHSLRHDFASQLTMRGADLRTLQQLMGHASIKQTAIYADLSPNHLQATSELLRATKPHACKSAQA